MRQHHFPGVTAFAHPCHCVDPVVEAEDVVQAEAIHAQIRPRADEFLQVVQIGGVATVSDDHPGQVHALLGEDPLLIEAPPGVGMGVGGDRYPGGAMGLADRTQHALDAGGEARFVGGALENPCLDAGVGDALGDIPDEQIDHDLRAVQCGAGTGEVKEHRDVVVGVDAGGHYDL